MRTVTCDCWSLFIFLQPGEHWSRSWRNVQWPGYQKVRCSVKQRLPRTGTGRRRTKHGRTCSRCGSPRPPSLFLLVTDKTPSSYRCCDRPRVRLQLVMMRACPREAMPIKAMKTDARRGRRFVNTRQAVGGHRDPRQERIRAASKLPPVHPGEVLLEEFLRPLGISQYRLAKEVSVPPRRVNEIVHGNRAITADTALRLARYFGTTDRFWLNLQARYDLEVEQDRLGSRLEREVSILVG